WDAANQFMKEHSPKRYEAMQKLSKERQEPLKNNVFRRYRILEALRLNDSDIYDLHVKRVGVEDEIFELTRDLRNASSTEEDKVRKTLHDKIGELLDLEIEERKIRINRWKKLIAQEQEA